MSVSLFCIEHALSDLFDARQELEEQSCFTPEQAAEKRAAQDAVDLAIVEYVTAEIKKVDGIARLLIEWKARTAALRKEADRLNCIATDIEANGQRLKEMVLQIMRDCDVKKLEGKIGTLRRQANGGAQGVDVRQVDLVPDEMKRVNVTISAESWEAVRKLAAGVHWNITAECKVSAPEPDLTAIGEELRKGKAVPGCVLKDRGEHLRVS